MAPKRSKLDLLESPPSASPSKQSSSDEADSSSEDLTPQPKPAAQNPQSSSSGDSGSESESESEPEDTLRSVSEPVVKPLSPKAVAPAATKKARSKSSPTPAVAKRPAENELGKKESKKAKQAAEGGKGAVIVEKSTPRVWSEEEEILILKAMISYEENIGFKPLLDMEAFHYFVKKSLRADASRNQLYEKVRRLKRKYWDNVEKLKKDETVSSSWKTHEKKLFDLSRKIWRGESNGLQSPKIEKAKSIVKSKKTENQSGSKPNSSLPPKMLEASPTSLVDGAKEVKKKIEVEKNLAPLVNLAEDHLLDTEWGSGDIERFVREKGLDLIKGPKRAELEERWANLHNEELELFVERTKLILEQAKLVLAAQK